MSTDEGRAGEWTAELVRAADPADIAEMLNTRYNVVLAANELSTTARSSVVQPNHLNALEVLRRTLKGAR